MTIVIIIIKIIIIILKIIIIIIIIIIMFCYCPTLFGRVQITRETSTNITRYLYSSHFPFGLAKIVHDSYTAILHTKTSNKI